MKGEAAIVPILLASAFLLSGCGDEEKPRPVLVPREYVRPAPAPVEKPQQIPAEETGNGDKDIEKLKEDARKLAEDAKKILSERAEKLGNRLSEKGQAVLEKSQEIVEETSEMVRRKSEELIDKTMEALESLKQQQSPPVEPGKESPTDEKVRI